MRYRKRWIAGVVAGVLIGFAPAIGLLVTVLGLVYSFQAVSGPGVDPASKSQMLATGISTSMWGTAIGLALLPVGAIVLGISIWRLIATRLPD